MKKILKISVLLGMTFFIGCSSDGGGTPSVSNVTLTTTTPQLVGGINITSGGHASNNISNFNCGICYSTSPGPTILSNLAAGTLSSNTDFTGSFAVSELGTTYYIKAYVQDPSTNEVKYGNEVSITVPLSLSTGIVKGISANGFNVDITVGADLSTNTERGVVYGGGQNPKITDTGVQSFPMSDNGAGTFHFNIESYVYVLPNTTYYIRSYVKMGDNYYYSNQQSFRTAGYIGGSGGFVFYDKGETTNGWRYLEAYSSYLLYNNSSTYDFKYSCNTNFISGISSEIGTGLENSHIIKNICNYNNVGCAVALDKTYNGQASGSWFVPSINELKELYKMKVIGLTDFGSIIDLLSSSQESDVTAYAFHVYESGAGTQFSISKTSEYYHVWPVRRF